MEFLKQWAVSVCSCGIVATLFSALAPKGKMEKLLKIVISVFILTSLVTPFLSLTKSDFELITDHKTGSITIEELQEKTNELTAKAMDKQLEDNIAQTLEASGYGGCAVTVHSLLREDGSYAIESINVQIPEKNSAHSSEIRSLLKEKFSYDMNIEVKGDSSNEY